MVTFNTYHNHLLGYCVSGPGVVIVKDLYCEVTAAKIEIF